MTVLAEPTTWSFVAMLPLLSIRNPVPRSSDGGCELDWLLPLIVVMVKTLSIDAEYMEFTVFDITSTRDVFRGTPVLVGEIAVVPS